MPKIYGKEVHFMLGGHRNRKEEIIKDVEEFFDNHGNKYKEHFTKMLDLLSNTAVHNIAPYLRRLSTDSEWEGLEKCIRNRNEKFTSAYIHKTEKDEEITSGLDISDGSGIGNYVGYKELWMIIDMSLYSKIILVLMHVAKSKYSRSFILETLKKEIDHFSLSTMALLEVERSYYDVIFDLIHHKVTTGPFKWKKAYKKKIINVDRTVEELTGSILFKLDPKKNPIALINVFINTYLNRCIILHKGKIVM